MNLKLHNSKSMRRLTYGGQENVTFFFLRSKLKGIRSRGQTIEGFHLNSTSNLVLGKTDWASQDIRKAISKLHKYVHGLF